MAWFCAEGFSVLVLLDWLKEGAERTLTPKALTLFTIPMWVSSLTPGCHECDFLGWWLPTTFLLYQKSCSWEWLLKVCIYELQKDGPQESYLANPEPLVEGIKLQGGRWIVGPLSSLISPLSFRCLAEIKLSSSVRYAVVSCTLVC